MAKQRRLVQGDKFGRLTVSGVFTKNPRGKTLYECFCDCGKTAHLEGYAITSGNTRSCGCLRRELASLSFTTHGHTKGKKTSPEYVVWAGILKRCTNKNGSGYENYGGRGINVDQRWHSFDNFMEDMGERPSPAHSIDRKDNNAGYSKENCHWATRHEQNRNKRNNVVVHHMGKDYILKDLADSFGLSVQTIRYRLNRGWSVHDSVSLPLRRRA